jgi:hypothetical protein
MYSGVVYLKLGLHGVSFTQTAQPRFSIHMPKRGDVKSTKPDLSTNDDWMCVKPKAKRKKQSQRDTKAKLMKTGKVNNFKRPVETQTIDVTAHEVVELDCENDDGIFKDITNQSTSSKPNNDDSSLLDDDDDDEIGEYENEFV